MAQAAQRRVVRIEVSPRAGGDPLADALRSQAESVGVALPDATSRRVYLLETAEPADRLRDLALPLLADGVAEEGELFETAHEPSGGWIEILPKPGVTDPAAASAESALRGRGLGVEAVRTGRAFAIGDLSDEDRIALARLLANGVVEDVHFAPHLPAAFPHGEARPFALRHAELLDLDDAGLQRLSREGHLFLSLTEMRAVQDYFKQQGREPTDAELETIAQTWSEHCVHKTLKSKVVVEDAGGKEIGRYGNLIKETIFASTQQIMRQKPEFCLSVFVDNAGIVAFDDSDGVCIKVETHNRPSAIEPYGGAATGIGGVIRDVLGTGLGARPVACTDVFCVADESAAVPDGVIPPGRILDGIVGGVRDYGNRMGIPTVNGAIVFHDDYVANPLVFCGCVGVIPRDKIDKAPAPGDRIVVLGGRTGRDGIHGATFSSAELTDTHGSEFGHAVQIGNPITEKIVADVLLQARDRDLFTAVTDCGAGGLSSAIGEMGETVGAFVELHKVPLKYAGLRYDEVWISEAQERMVLSVPPEKLEALLALCRAEDLEATDIGHFGETDGGPGPTLRLMWEATEVGRLSMAFLHDGIPMPERKALVRTTGVQPVSVPEHGLEARGMAESLLQALASPNVASKHRVVRQYDTEVLGGTVVKPFVGPMQIGPADAAVVRPKLGSNKAVAIGCGLAPHVEDPYAMSIASIDEAIRNVVCVGADLDRVALLDNFCWPGTDDADTLGTLVQSCEACRDAALALGTPFISGKDSLHNQFADKRTGRTIRIPRTLLITAMGVVDDAARCVTSDLKRDGDALWLVAPRAGDDPTLRERRAAHAAVAKLIAGGNVTAAHDVSDGGWLVAVAEMCIGGGLGARLETTDHAFAEPLTTYVLTGRDLAFGDAVIATRLGAVTTETTLAFNGGSVSVDALRRAWRRE